MNRYSFFSVIFKDKILFILLVFAMTNTFAYSAQKMFGETLILPRFILLMLTLISIVVNLRGRPDFFKFEIEFLIYFILIVFLSFFYSLLGNPSLQGFISIFIPLIAYSVFVKYIYFIYPSVADKIIVDILIYSIIYVPIVLLSNFSYIRDNLYGNNDIESIGLTSRTLGWTCCFLFSCYLFKISNRRGNWIETVFIFILAYFVLISGSRSALISMLASFFLFLVMYKSYSIFLYFILFISLCLFSYFYELIFSLISDVSFFQRQRAKDLGFSSDRFRYQVLGDSIELLFANPMHFLFGYGPGTFRTSLSDNISGYRFNTLGSHNTFLEVIFTTGVFGLLCFFRLYIIDPIVNFIRFNSAFLIIYIPIIIISITENNFGFGQYLFFSFSFLSFFSYFLKYQGKNLVIMTSDI